VKKMSLTPGDDDLGSQRRLPRRKLRKRPRDPFLEAQVQIDAALFNKDIEFPDHILFRERDEGALWGHRGSSRCLDFSRGRCESSSNLP